MEIILLQKVANLGLIGDRVKVKSGYARNYLVPTGRATMATAANIAKFEAQRHELEAKAHEELAAAQAPRGQFREFQAGDHTQGGRGPAAAAAIRRGRAGGARRTDARFRGVGSGRRPGARRRFLPQGPPAHFWGRRRPDRSQPALRRGDPL